MGRCLLSLLVPLLALAAGCGKEIGDSCSFATDCDPNGQRICVDPTAGHGGYCTIQGCDFSTCPDDAACIRFFTGTFANHLCNPLVENDLDNPPAEPACTPDELCAITGSCVPRASEVRYCMKTCDNDGDCRDGYECRSFKLMMEHGGQAVLAPKVPVDEAHSPKFCAVAPAK